MSFLLRLTPIFAVIAMLILWFIVFKNSICAGILMMALNLFILFVFYKIEESRREPSKERDNRTS